MYKQNLVVCIKAGGKILREAKDLVHLPFGTEFSVLIKNLNSRRAQFTLHIDGTDALDGNKLIVNANSEVEVKRFIRNGNMEEGNAFKFIERTQQIEDGPRGVKIDDGIVRVEYWFEKEAPIINHVHTYYYPYYYGPYYYPSWYNSYPCGYIVTCNNGYSSAGGAASSIATVNASNVNLDAVASADTETYSNASSVFSATTSNVMPQNSCSGLTQDSSVNDVGITVPGSKVEQTFTPTFWFNAEEVSHVIILRLAGFVGTTKVSKPITVQTKCKCDICGRLNKSTANFCAGCGAALVLV